MTAVRPALGLLAALVAFASALPAAAQVAVVIREPADRETAGQLRQLIDVEVEERELSGPSVGLSSVLEQAQSWSAAYAVLIDRPGGMAQVLRLADRTAASRVLATDMMAEAPYAVALAIAELLEWLGAVPPARAPDTLEEVDRAEPLESEARPAAYAMSIVVGADFEVTSSPGYDVSLLRPAIGAGLQWGRGEASPWFGVGARLSAPASTERDRDPSSPGGIAQVRYASLDPAVNASLGLGAGKASLVTQLGFGVSIIEFEGRNAMGARLAVSDVLTPWLGLGLFLRYPVVWGLSLSVGAEGQWLVERGRYRVDGRSVLEEGPVRLATRFGICWESAP